MNKDDTKQTIIGFMEFTKGITGNKDLKIPEDIAKEYGIEQEPCEDAVSRQAAIKLFLGKVHDEYPMLSDIMIGILESLPSVTPQPKTVHWIDNHNNTISCDHCYIWFKKDDRYRYMHYCPNCGAKMKNEGYISI